MRDGRGKKVINSESRLTHSAPGGRTTPSRQCAGNQDHRGVSKIVCRGTGKSGICVDDAVIAASAADADTTPWSKRYECVDHTTIQSGQLGCVS